MFIALIRATRVQVSPRSSILNTNIAKYCLIKLASEYLFKLCLMLPLYCHYPIHLMREQCSRLAKSYSRIALEITNNVSIINTSFLHKTSADKMKVLYKPYNLFIFLILFETVDVTTFSIRHKMRNEKTEDRWQWNIFGKLLSAWLQTSKCLQKMQLSPRHRYVAYWWGK